MFSYSQCPNFPQDEVPTLDRIGAGPTGLFGKVRVFTFSTALSQCFFGIFFRREETGRLVSGKPAPRLVFLRTGERDEETAKSVTRRFGPDKIRKAPLFGH